MPLDFMEHLRYKCISAISTVFVSRRRERFSLRVRLMKQRNAK